MDAESGEKEYEIVNWDESDAGENPRNWRPALKTLIVIVMSCYTLMSPMTSSMNAPALDTLQKEFAVKNPVVVNLMMSTQMLALVLGPMVYGPLSEQFGRKNILQISNVMFLIFNVGCGLSQNATQMIVLRFFTGLVGCAPLSLGAGMVVDLYEPHERGGAMATYTLSPLMGPCIGPIFAGWIIQAWGPDKWRWIFWSSTMFGVVVAAVGLAVLRETYAPVLLQRKARRLRKETGNAKLRTRYHTDETFFTRARHMVARPAIFFATQPVVAIPCLYQGIVFGCQYLLMSEFPRAFYAAYRQPPGIASLHYLALLLAFLLAGQVGGRLVDVVYRRLSERNGGEGRPEFKLPILMITGILMPSGLLLYGWTLEYRVHWVVPDIGIFLVACGVRGAVFGSILYVVDSVTVYSASAASSLVMMRGALSFSFPLFAPAMYAKLGQGWGNSLLALVTAVVGLPAPFVLYRYGPALRRNSTASREGMRLMT